MAQLASALVMADLPDPPPADDDDLSDMPKLEKTPPRKFSFPPKKCHKEHIWVMVLWCCVYESRKGISLYHLISFFIYSS